MKKIFNIKAPKIKIVFVLLFCSSIVIGQGTSDFICHMVHQDDPPGSAVDTIGTASSQFGRAFTPKGNMRFLLVYAGFKGYETQDVFLNEWGNHTGAFNEAQLPTYLDYQAKTTHPLFFNAPSDFESGGPIDNPDNVSASKILNVMSKPNEDFRFFGEVFTDSTGAPAMVVVDPFVDPNTGLPYLTNDDIPNSWSETNRAVIRQMHQMNPDFDWYRYDERENNPNYVFDNSANPLPDSIIDYIVIVYKYNNNTIGDWTNQPADTVIVDAPGDTIRIRQRTWTGSGGGVDQVSLGDVTLANGETISFGPGFTMQKGGGLPISLFVHESAHSIYHCPHYFGANNVVGNYFYKHSCGWGATASIRTSRSYTAWDRWYLGYIDGTDVQASGTYELNDFITSGDALRIEIPFSGGQHLWIENHSGEHELDEHQWAGADILQGINLGDSPNGVYMYVENIASSRKIFGFTNVAIAGANGMKFINPTGNWDFEVDTTIAPVVDFFQNGNLRYERKRENPIAGMSPSLMHRFDYNGDGQIGHSTNHNGGGANEHQQIKREYVNDIDEFLYRSFNADTKEIPGYTRKTAFLQGDSISMGTNPIILNHAEYNITSNQWQPFFLNGLRIDITSINDSGIAVIDIQFKQPNILNDVRWTGNIVLPDISESAAIADLILAEDREIILDMSETNNRRTIHPIHNDFINPTTFTIESGSKIHLKDRARIRVKNNSTLIIEEGAEVLLDQHACIIVEETGTLYLKGNSIDLSENNSVIILKGTLKTDDDVDFTFTGSGFIDIHPSHQIDMGLNSNFVIERPITSDQERFMRLRDNTVLGLSDRELRLRYGKVIYGENAQIGVTDGGIVAVGTIFEGNNNAIGLRGVDLDDCQINFNEFYTMERGIDLYGNNTVPVIKNNLMEWNTNGIVAQQMDQIILRDNHIYNFITEGIRLTEIDNADITGNVIDGSTFGDDGMALDEVNAAWIGTTFIQNCQFNGIRAHESNVILSGGSTIENNLNGVFFENNATAEWALSVGTCNCAHIINNDTGVKGNNLVLHIDAKENATTCNSDMDMPPNRFDGNTLVFDICYTDLSFPTTTAVLMRGNYWGPQPLSISGNYKIRGNGCANPTSGLPIDDSDAVTDINLVPNCSIIQSPNPGPPKYPEKETDCEVVELGTTVLVHEQARLAFADFYDKNTAAALSAYQPVADLDPLVHNSPACVHKINFARCIVEALENDQYATPNSSEWHKEAVLKNSVADPVRISPNPATSNINLLAPADQSYSLEVYDIMGRVVYKQSFVANHEVLVGDWERGLYLFTIVDEKGQRVQVTKINLM